MSNVAKEKVDPKIRQVTISSVLGATIEWYDFFLYGVVAGLVFNKLYFPSDDIFVSTMLAYATFAVGFVARPLGGIIFGHFGDKVGRKSMLILTMMIMGVATVGIALVPTYDQIGVAAPILLLLLRILQGLGIGGEWGGSVLMVYEYAPDSRKGFFASFPQMGLAFGLTLSSGVVGLLSLFLSNDQFMSWGWRVAFGASIILVFIAQYIRRHLDDTPEFEETKEEGQDVKIPFLELWKGHTGNVIAGMGSRYVEGVFFNVFGVFSITYMTQHLGIDRTQALLGVTIAAIVMVFFIPLFGHLSDKYGRTRVYGVMSIACGLVAFPAFYFMSLGNLYMVWLLGLVIPFGIIYAGIYGPEAALFAELFDPEVRYTGVSFVYQFSGIFASGITPMVATFLLQANGGNPWMLCGYVLFTAVISTISVWWIGKHAVRPEGGKIH